jgi:hypothetical protein
VKCEDVFDEISVWIDDTDTFTIPEVLSCEITNEDGFTSSWFTDDIVMTPTIFVIKIDRLFFVSVFIPSEENWALADRESAEDTFFFFWFWQFASISRLSTFITSVREHYFFSFSEDKSIIFPTGYIAIFISFELGVPSSVTTNSPSRT